ncbi:dehydroascorbate reductase 2 [Artemisia annua]|uniref:glutathione transferase n=1 Tax=Artemisia annua TaxID=35608 RepID=A0A2U1MID7_ARTAN|nr:dehydroascorbate reductase 2 [Artemisia annua]
MSETTKEPEAIMICVDTSGWMEGTKSPMFQEQLEAIKLYCNNKFSSHIQNVVGVCGMGEQDIGHMIYPTRCRDGNGSHIQNVVGVCGMGEQDIGHMIYLTRCLSKIIAAIYAVRIGGYLIVDEAVAFAYSIWFGSLDTDLPKRIAVFAGGPVYQTPLRIEKLARQMKKVNLACDIINFGHRFMDKKNLFKTLIDKVDNNGNCNICHVPPELSVSDALIRSQINTPHVGVSGSAPSASFALQHDREKIVICVEAAPKDPLGVLGYCPFCQRVLLTLAEKNVPYDVHLINLDNKPEWFVEVNPDGILPLIKFGDDEKWYSNSDDIVEMIDAKYPQAPLLTPPMFASVGFKILPKVLNY